MDDRRPAQAGAQNPAYRPAHPPLFPSELHRNDALTCAGTSLNFSVHRTQYSLEQRTAHVEKQATLRFGAGWPMTRASSGGPQWVIVPNVTSLVQMVCQPIPCPSSIAETMWPWPS